MVSTTSANHPITTGPGPPAAINPILRPTRNASAPVRPWRPSWIRNAAMDTLRYLSGKSTARATGRPNFDN